MKKKVSTRKMVVSAFFAALTFAATLIHIHVPGMQMSYVNLGDCLVIVSGILLGPVYGSMAAGIGSALTEFIHGAMYVFPAFVIKAVMALVVYFLYFVVFKGKKNCSVTPVVIAGVFAEIIMIGGYFLFGVFIFGFSGAVACIPGNCAQAVITLIVTPLLICYLKKTKVIDLLEHHNS